MDVEGALNAITINGKPDAIVMYATNYVCIKGCLLAITFIW